jgi:diguanylate cyclase (GGDEF)-like protein
VARIGGEEFAIVMPETGYKAALDVARKLRGAVSQTVFKVDGQGVRVTASFGLCGIDRVSAGERRLAQRMLKIADAALYRSKHDGRNRVTASILDARSADAVNALDESPGHGRPERERASSA